MNVLADFSFSTIATSLATACVTSLGLGTLLRERWLAKYKSALDERAKRLEAELSRHVHTTQTRFDTEFNAIKDIFAELGKLLLRFAELRPQFDVLPVDKEDEQKEMMRRLQDFEARYNSLVNTAHILYPFVPEDIYAEVQKCMIAAKLEHSGLAGASSDIMLHPVRYPRSKSEEQEEKFRAAYFAAANLVRLRFTNWSVV